MEEKMDNEKVLPSLWKAYEKYFHVGTSVNEFQLMFPGANQQIILDHFDEIVAENVCKQCNVTDGRGNYTWEKADKFLEFGKANNKKIRWHALVWHNQAAQKIFTDDSGNFVSKDELNRRLKDFIFTVGDHIKGKVESIDVVNECISDKHFNLRTQEERSIYNGILGPEYIDNAFFWAREACPNTQLVINDYNLETIEAKRDGLYNLVKGMLSRGVPVDAVGLQMHINQFNPPVKQIEEAIELYGSLGLQVLLTEMEVSGYDFEDHSLKVYDADFLNKQADRYEELFKCFKRCSEKGLLKDVLFWGTADHLSWKNDFPVFGRGDNCLLFDRVNQPKPAFFRVIEAAGK